MPHWTVQQLKRSLAQHPRIYGAARYWYVRRHIPYSLILRHKRIRQYLQNNSCRKVQVGAGSHKSSGWLVTDYNPMDLDVIYLDARRAFPFADDTIDYYFSEHVIAELSYKHGRHMLKEMFRTLRRGGYVRIATPDLERIISLYAQHPPGSLEARYMDWSQSNMSAKAPKMRPSFAINHLIGGFGHQFVYDAATLSDALEETGFTDVTRRAVRESENPVLKNLEQHGGIIGDDFNLFETLILEARKR